LRIVDAMGLSDVGRHRQANEDSYVVSPPLFAVADGMGGARAGEVASRLAVETLEGEPELEVQPEGRLVELVRAANRRIWELSREDESHAGMGTTLTAALVDGDDVVTAHVGDSRLYRLREGTMERLTTDHSLVEELVRQGKLTPEGAERHPQKSIITRALGPEPDVEVESFSARGRAGDVYLICSDGLTGMISESHVREILGRAGPLRDAAHALVDAANDGGGRDNITVVLFRLEVGEPGETGREPHEAEADTLTGRETEDGLRGEDVRAAVAEQRGSGVGDTIVLSAGAVRAAREQAEAPPTEPLEERPPPRDERPPPREERPPPRERRRPRRSGPARGVRRGLGVLLGLTLVGAAVVGLRQAARQVYFLGTEPSGLIALYRGLPYEGPFGLALYEEVRVSTVPARSISAARREAILDHELRSRQDAADLVAQLEQGRIP
jgi:protein phosphatase